MFRILKISGDSLTPEYRNGDFVLVSKIPFLLRPVRAGDIVAFRQPGYGLLIKMVERLAPQGGGVFVVGTQPDSVDSRVFGEISPRQIVGKVIWHIKDRIA